MISKMIADAYKPFIDSIKQHETNPHYLGLLCLKDTTSGPRYDESSDKYKETVTTMSGRENLKCKCVLPKGHNGKCKNNLNHLFKKNAITEKLKTSISLATSSTPGNDDFVYKNRASRLHPIVLSSEEEKKIRNKNEKKKYAIPLKDASSPILIAQSTIDWVTFMVNIEDISEHIEHDNDENKDILSMLDRNKKHLISVFASSNREIFDRNGYSMCVITRNTIKLSDVSEPSRDNRVHILDSDIQLGHNFPRSEEYVSIRGENLIPMSRRGNLIIGERVFTQDIWVNELKNIVTPY